MDLIDVAEFGRLEPSSAQARKPVAARPALLIRARYVLGGLLPALLAIFVVVLLVGGALLH